MGNWAVHVVLELEFSFANELELRVVADVAQPPAHGVRSGSRRTSTQASYAPSGLARWTLLDTLELSAGTGELLWRWRVDRPNSNFGLRGAASGDLQQLSGSTAQGGPVALVPAHEVRKLQSGLASWSLPSENDHKEFGGWCRLAVPRCAACEGPRHCCLCTPAALVGGLAANACADAVREHCFWSCLVARTVLASLQHARVAAAGGVQQQPLKWADRGLAHQPDGTVSCGLRLPRASQLCTSQRSRSFTSRGLGSSRCLRPGVSALWGRQLRLCRWWTRPAVALLLVCGPY